MPAPASDAVAGEGVRVRFCPRPTGTPHTGMVRTVEPGLYFQNDDLTVPAKYRGIGVRIEDDVLVTEKGHLNLSKSIPSAPSEIEAWMKKVWRSAKS